MVEEVAERGARRAVDDVIDADGTRRGYDLELIERVCDAVRCRWWRRAAPAAPADMVEALRAGAQAALAASIFHDAHHSIDEVKREVAAAGLPVRL